MAKVCQTWPEKLEEERLRDGESNQNQKELKSLKARLLEGILP